MSSNADNKSKSKEKKKLTARQIQRANADCKKFDVLPSPSRSTLTNAASVLPQILQSPPPPTKLPPNFNQLLPKSKKFDAVSDSNIIMGICILPDDPKDMLPTIQKQIKNNFTTSYVIHQKQARPSRSTTTKSASTTSIISNNNNTFHSKCGSFR